MSGRSTETGSEIAEVDIREGGTSGSRQAVELG